MHASSLYWLAVQHQASTLRRQKIGFLTRNLVQILMNLVFLVKTTGTCQKMAKTKVVRENANWHRSEAKGQETKEESARSSKRSFFDHILIIFLFLMRKD